MGIAGRKRTRIKPIINAVDATQREFKGVAIGTLAAIVDYLIQNGADHEDIDLFLRQLRGVETPCQQVHVLRQRLESNAKDKMGRLPQEYIAAFIVKTWNAYIMGSELKILKYAPGGANPDTFPKIITRL